MLVLMTLIVVGFLETLQFSPAMELTLQSLVVTALGQRVGRKRLCLDITTQQQRFTANGFWH